MLRRIISQAPSLNLFTPLQAFSFAKYVRDKAHLNVGTVGMCTLLIDHRSH